MAATINGVTFSDSVDNSPGSRYLEGQPGIGLPIYELENITSPGADGSIQKNFGYRSQTVTATLAFIESTAPLCISAAASFANGLAPARFSGTFSGVAMSNLQAIQCSPGVPFLIQDGETPAAKVLVTFHAERRA